MRRPFDVKTPRPVGALGAEKSTEAGNLGKHDAPHGATERPCYCRPGATTCITCLTWDRTIRGHEARRAESLRLQAIGRRVAGGSI